MFANRVEKRRPRPEPAPGPVDDVPVRLLPALLLQTPPRNRNCWDFPGAEARKRIATAELNLPLVLNIAMMMTIAARVLPRGWEPWSKLTTMRLGLRETSPARPIFAQLQYVRPLLFVKVFCVSGKAREVKDVRWVMGVIFHGASGA